MTDIDLRLRIQNQQVLNRLEALTTQVQNVRVNLQVSNLQGVRNQIRTFLQQNPINVTIVADTRALRNLNRSISQSIGTIPISLNIVNSPQILQQIQNLVSAAGGGVINPANANVRGRGRVSASTLLREQARFVRAGVATPEDLGLIPQGTIGRSLGGTQALSAGRTARNVRARGDLFTLEQAQLTAQRRAAKLASAQETFERDFRFQRLFQGRDNAARDFEVKKGLNAGSINRNFRDRAFDVNRLRNPESFNELAFAGLFGGPTGLAGGLVGGAALGRPGVFLGSAAAQVVVRSVTDTFGKITELLGDVAQAGLELQKSLLGLSTAFLTTGKFLSPGGSTLGVGESIIAANQRSRNLLQSTAPSLANIGIPLGTTALALRRSQTALGERGINLSDKQLSRLNQVVLSRVAAFDPELLNQPQKLGTGFENIFGAASNAKTGELAQVIGVQNVEKITQAVKAGDIDKLTQTIEGLSGAFDFLSKNASTAVLPLNRIGTVFEQLRQNAGDRFLSAITPSLNKLADTLSSGRTSELLVGLADSIGRFIDVLISKASDLLNFGKQNPGLFGAAVGGLAGFGQGAITGAIGGGLVGGLPGAFTGAALGGISGGLVGAFEGSNLGNESLINAANPTTNTDFATRRRLLQSLNGQLQRGEITDEEFNNLSANIKAVAPVNFSGSGTKTLDLGADIDSETFAGRIEAKRVELEKQVQDNKLTQRVADIQLSRFEQNTGIEREQEKFKVEEAFRKLPDIIDSAGFKVKEFESAIVSTTNSLKALDSQTQINRLEGEQKAIALIQEQSAKGGVLDQRQAELLRQRFGDRAGLVLNEGLLGSGLSGEQRERSLASAQLTNFLQRFDPENEAAGERARLEQQNISSRGQVRDVNYDVNNAITQANNARTQFNQKDGGSGGLFSAPGSPYIATSQTSNIPATQIPSNIGANIGQSINQSQNEVFSSINSALNQISLNTQRIAENTAPLASLGSN